MLSKIKSWFKKIKEQYRLYKEDKENRKLFVETVKAELSSRDSFFSMYNIRVDNDNYYQIIYPINIPKEFQLAGQDWQIKDKLNEISFIVSRYLKTERGYNKNINDPEFYHLEDPSDDKVSTSYIAVWTFENQLKSKKTIYTINTIGSILSVSFIGYLIWLFII